MRLNPSFVKHTMDGSTVLVPVDGAKFHGLVQGNKTVAAILDCLAHDTTEEEIVKMLCDKYDGDPQIIKADVIDVISKLKGIGAIDE